MIVSIRDDVEQIALQFVLARPDIFLEFDTDNVALVERHEDGAVYAADVVFVENEDSEVVIGDIRIGTDLMLDLTVFSE